NRKRAEEDLVEAVNRALEEAELSGDGREASGDRKGNDAGMTSRAYEIREDNSAGQVREDVAGVSEIERVNSERRYAETAAVRAVTESRASEYPMVDIQPQVPQERFYEPEGGIAIQRQIARIIAAEGPITESLLLRRAAAEWGFNRIGPRIREIFAKLL